MGSQKPRIIPWLIEQINSQSYPGLEWSNPEKTLFRIPWKHGLRHDRSEEDVKIFEAWAIASRSYDPTKDTPNPAVWKRNFRSALNRKTEICVIEDKSSDSTNPHKIYALRREGAAGGDLTPEDYYLSDSISPSSDIPSFRSPESQYTLDRNLSQEITAMRISEDDLYLAPEDLQKVDWYQNIPSPDLLLPGAIPVPSPYSPHPEPSVHDQEASQEQVDTLQQQLLTQFFPQNGFETQFDVKIYYRGTLVQNTLVKNSRGFHLTSRPHMNPEAYLEEVVLPPPNMILDSKVAAEIKKILQNLEQGTQLEVQNGVFCARRLGKCRSFWSMTDMPETHQPCQINKDGYSKLFKFQQFVKELIEFIEQKRKESPQYEIWICLGELWPDDKSWKKKLIMVQVTSVSMQILHQLSYNTGASSLRSSDINLQISDSLSLRSTSDLLTFLKEFEEKMDCDWAIAGGFYDPENQEKYLSRWKRNFRSALQQKSNIRLVADLGSDAKPHKVFEILGGVTETVPTEECAGADVNPSPGSHQVGDRTVMECSFQMYYPTAQPTQLPSPKVHAHPETMNRMHSIESAIPAPCTDLVFGVSQQTQQNTLLDVVNDLQLYEDDAVTDFEVNIYYRGAQVKKTVVTNRFGFCLTSRQQPLPGNQLEDVAIPLPETLVTDQLLVQSVNHILTNLDHGTLVEVRDGAICARRSGKCRSFWSITCTPTSILPSPIEKDDYSVLYTLQQFVVELMEFIEGRRKKSPQYSIWICLGETWPDGKPWKEKCIMVEIIPLVMRLLHEISHSTGASSFSLTDVNFEISNSLTGPDAALSILRSIEERMDWELFVEVHHGRFLRTAVKELLMLIGPEMFIKPSSSSIWTPSSGGNSKPLSPSPGVVTPRARCIIVDGVTKKIKVTSK
ncbi:interferon regulatory factor 3 [Gastrophryne carolinensis]